MRKSSCGSSLKETSQIDRKRKSITNFSPTNFPHQFKIASGNRIRDAVAVYNGFRDVLNTPHVLVDSRTMEWLQEKSGSVTTALSTSHTANSISMASKAVQKVIANAMILQSSLINSILEQVGSLVNNIISPFLELADSDFELAVSESIAE